MVGSERLYSFRHRGLILGIDKSTSLAVRKNTNGPIKGTLIISWCRTILRDDTQSKSLGEHTCARLKFDFNGMGCCWETALHKTYRTTAYQNYLL